MSLNEVNGSAPRRTFFEWWGSLTDDEMDQMLRLPAGFAAEKAWNAASTPAQSGSADASDFTSQLRALINAHSLENASETPDFILAQYLTGCLRTWDQATQRRETWYYRGGKQTSVQRLVRRRRITPQPPNWCKAGWVSDVFPDHAYFSHYQDANPQPIRVFRSRNPWKNLSVRQDTDGIWWWMWHSPN